MSNLQRIIKEQTLKSIRMGRPFQYLKNLSIVGYQNYGVSSKDSFQHGLNHSLDWYNYYKREDYDLKTEFYALKQGANAILEYVAEAKEK